MIVERLRLRNFRNIPDSTFVPDRHINLLFGRNAQGKTSVLEALNYLATLRSFRGGKPADVIRKGEQTAEISCLVADTDAGGIRWESELKIEFKLRAQGRSTVPVAQKAASIDGKPFRSSTEYLRHRFRASGLGIHTIVFNPSDHELVRGEPKLRRDYLNRVLAAEDEDYLQDLSSFRQVLEQRNALLKDERRRSRDLLMPFTVQMAELSARIAYRRLNWLERLIKKANEIVVKIAPQQQPLTLFYLSDWLPFFWDLVKQNSNLDRELAGHSPTPSLEEIERAFWLRYSAVEEAEWRVRSSLVGPHRDDWAFHLEEQPLKARGSQGEVRSVLLALKLAEIDLFREQTGLRPLFLLDDFSSELDRERRAFLLNYIQETDLQVFVTTTEGHLFEGKRFHVVDGRIVPLEPGEELPSQT